jgi:hypothetical protein
MGHLILLIGVRFICVHRKNSSFRDKVRHCILVVFRALNRSRIPVIINRYWNCHITNTRIQYKSRNCFGLIKNICTEHDYDLFIINYSETSHAKGPQDAAGGFLKNQVDLAIYRRSEIIQSANKVLNFFSEKLIVFVIRANHEKVFCYDKRYIG